MCQRIDNLFEYGTGIPTFEISTYNGKIGNSILEECSIFCFIITYITQLFSRTGVLSKQHCQNFKPYSKLVLSQTEVIYNMILYISIRLSMIFDNYGWYKTHLSSST